MSKLSDKLKNLFSKTRGASKGANYPAKFERTAFKAGQKTKNLMKGVVSKSLFKKPTISNDAAKSLSRALVTSSTAKKLRGASKLAKIGRTLTPIGLAVSGAGLAYDVATMSPEKKAKVKKLKTKLSKKSTKDYHADLLKMSTGGDTMLKGGQKKLDKNKDGKISGEDFKLMEKNTGGAIKGMGAARTSGMGLQDENLIPGKSLDYYKDIM
jgi:hypothetical protein